MRLANGSGSSKDRKIALGLRAMTASSTCGRLRSAQVMKPQPTAWLPAAANSRSNQRVVVGYSRRRESRARPRSITAAASLPPAITSIGALITGWVMPSRSVNRVEIGIAHVLT